MKSGEPPKRKVRLTSKTPLRRGKQPARGKNLETRSQLERGGPIKPRSEKRQAEMDGPRGAMNQELRDRPRPCALGPLWATVGVRVCTGMATCWHERRKAGQGGSRVNPRNVMASCVLCNEQVEEQPAKAALVGLVVSEGHVEWEALGKRASRTE